MWYADVRSGSSHWSSKSLGGANDRAIFPGDGILKRSAEHACSTLERLSLRSLCRCSRHSSLRYWWNSFSSMVSKVACRRIPNVDCWHTGMSHTYLVGVLFQFKISIHYRYFILRSDACNNANAHDNLIEMKINGSDVFNDWYATKKFFDWV